MAKKYKKISLRIPRSLYKNPVIHICSHNVSMFRRTLYPEIAMRKKYFSLLFILALFFFTSVLHVREISCAELRRSGE